MDTFNDLIWDIEADNRNKPIVESAEEKEKKRKEKKIKVINFFFLF